MPAVQIRNLPQDTYDLLKAEAQANGRSITKQTEAILIDFFAASRAVKQTVASASLAVETPDQVEERAQKRAALFARIDAAEPFVPAAQWSAAAMVREMRDQR